MRGFKVEGAEEKAAAELRQLKQQYDSGAISADAYEQRRKPLLAIMIAGQDDGKVEMRDGGAGRGGAGGRRAPLPRMHAMHAAAAPEAPAAAQPVPARGAGKQNSGNGQASRADFAQSHADGFDLTGAEKAVRHEFDPRERKWSRTAFLCRIEAKPFAEGAMRTAHRLFDLAATGADSLFVVKFSKDPNESAQRFFDDVQMQMEARMWAQKFNERGPPKSVDFIAAYVLELVDRPGKPLCGVEKFIPGTYVKWNNNWDWSDELRNTPQAFSHFTWQASGHKLLVCDLQGVGDLWTDPQIHTVDKQRFGKGNLGMEGINKFLSAHRCNSICDFFGLSPTPSSNPRRHIKPRGAHASSGPQRTVVEGAVPLTTKGLVGVGLALASRPPEGLVVTQVVLHGPAFKDGRVMAGDILLSVAGRKAGRDVEGVKGLILGPPGTSVVLGLKRGPLTYEVSLVRMFSEIPQGQRLVDSQKQRSKLREDASRSRADARPPSNGSRRSGLFDRMSKFFGGTKQQSVVGSSRRTPPRTPKDDGAGSPRDSGFNDPDIVRPAPQAAGGSSPAAKPAGWDDPDIAFGAAARRHGVKGGNLAGIQEWVLLEDDGVVGGVVGASELAEEEECGRSGAWGAIEADASRGEEALRTLVSCVLRHVLAEDGTAVMLRMSGVSRLWRSTSMDPSLWTTVRCGDDCVLSDDALSSICNRARGALDVLDIATSPQSAHALRGELTLYSIVQSVQFNPNIQELHVSGCCKHNEYALAEFGLVLQDLCRLQAFSMEACALTGRSVQKMMTLFACSTSLQSLSLAHNEGLGEDGVSVLCAALRVNQAVTSLDLRGCKVNKTAAEDLAQVLHMSPSLTDLYLDEADECSVALREEVKRQSFNFAAMQSQLLAAGTPEDAAAPAGAVGGSNDKSPGQKRGVCDGGFVAPGLEAVFGDTAVAGVAQVAAAAASNDAKQSAAQGHIAGVEKEAGVGGEDCAAGRGTSRGAQGSQLAQTQDGRPGLPLAVAPKWPRHVGCQTKMMWVDMEAERATERERQRQAGAEARGMLQEAQDALRAMAVERARLKTENQRLTKQMRVLEEEHTDWQAASTALMEQERAKLQLEADEKQKQAALDVQKQLSNANESEARAHIALEDLQRRLAAAEEETVRREASARATESKANEVLLQDLEKRVAAAVQSEAQTKVAKDALQETVDALRQKLAMQELEHKESERRWRDEVEAATRIGEQRRKEADLDQRQEEEEKRVRHDHEVERKAAEERERRNEEELQRAQQEASDARARARACSQELMQEAAKAEAAAAKAAAAVDAAAAAQEEILQLRECMAVLQRDKDRAIEKLQRERSDREGTQCLQDNAESCVGERGQVVAEAATSTSVSAEANTPAGFGTPAGTSSSLRPPSRLEALSPSHTPPRVDNDALSDPKSGGEGMRGTGTMTTWLGSGEGIGTYPRDSAVAGNGKGGKDETLAGLGEAVEGLSKSTTQLLGGVWGGLGGLVGIGGSAEQKHQSAVKSRIASIEHLESSLDPRTREAVKVLILKGRTDKQVVKHYTISERGITEEQVQAVRTQLALEQSSQHDAADGSPQAGPGLQVRNERPYCVVAIMPNSPAALNGKIRVGDILVSVQGQDVDFKTPDEVRNLMKGPEGSIIGMRFTRTTGGGDDHTAEPAESYPVTLRRALVASSAGGAAATGNGVECEDAGIGTETVMEGSANESPTLASQLAAGSAHGAHMGRRSTEDGEDSRRRQAGDQAGAERSGASRGSLSGASAGPPAGLGFTFQRDAMGKYWVVRRLKEGGFAQTSGLISPGDILLKVNGKAVSGLDNPEEVALLISGPDGSPCELQLKSPSTSQIRQVMGIRSRSTQITL